MDTILRPNVSNFVKSLRDMGYSFDIAIADILDNSISAGASEIHINHFEKDNNSGISIFDDGHGMSAKELKIAMSLGSKDPYIGRNPIDLGRFGLGLKTASFSQCTKLTVLSKKDGKLSALQWDLEKVIEQNDWVIVKPSKEYVKKIDQINKIIKSESGTLIIWEDIDKLEENEYSDRLYNLRSHLSLTFHRFIEGEFSKIRIFINEIEVPPFNPFNPNNIATQKLEFERFKISNENSTIEVQPYILPHYSKVSNLEYAKYGTAEDYTKTQGFYLYRGGRLIIHSTWWGLNKMSEAHKLVRIQIDISNNQDHLWNIDVKKSMAQPNPTILNELKRIINKVLIKGKRVYTGRGNKLKQSEKFIPFWDLSIENGEIKFLINKEHPLFLLNLEYISEPAIFLNFIKYLENFLPIPVIHSHLVSKPKSIKQEEVLNNSDIEAFSKFLKNIDLSSEQYNILSQSGIFDKLKENSN